MNLFSWLIKPDEPIEEKDDGRGLRIVVKVTRAYFDNELRIVRYPDDKEELQSRALPTEWVIRFEWMTFTTNLKLVERFVRYANKDSFNFKGNQDDKPEAIKNKFKKEIYNFMVDKLNERKEEIDKVTKDKQVEKLLMEDGRIILYADEL
jgi:hypothetical protein